MKKHMAVLTRPDLRKEVNDCGPTPRMTWNENNWNILLKGKTHFNALLEVPVELLSDVLSLSFVFKEFTQRLVFLSISYEGMMQFYF